MRLAVARDNVIDPGIGPSRRQLKRRQRKRARRWRFRDEAEAILREAGALTKAEIRNNERGYFSTAQEAAEAYERAARELFGTFARL